jgi:hypothetical protein
VPFPAAALEVMRRELDAPAPRAADDPGGPIRERTRNLRLTSMAGAMRRAGFSRDEIEAALLAVNRRRCRPPLPPAEVQGIARSVAKYPSNAPMLHRVVHTGALPSTDGAVGRRRHRKGTVQFSFTLGGGR